MYKLKSEKDNEKNKYAYTETDAYRSQKTLDGLKEVS